MACASRLSQETALTLRLASCVHATRSSAATTMAIEEFFILVVKRLALPLTFVLQDGLRLHADPARHVFPLVVQCLSRVILLSPILVRFTNRRTVTAHAHCHPPIDDLKVAVHIHLPAALTDAEVCRPKRSPS